MIGIIYIQEINNCPFLSKYTDILDKLDEPYKVIYWNRNINKSIINVIRTKKHIEYQKYQNLLNPRWEKLFGFLRFKLFLNKEIRDCDKLILLTTMSSILVVDKLWRYKKNYIFDFRDPSLERNMIFKMILKYIIKFSRFTCISSPAFTEILPKNEYCISNNFRYKDIEISKREKFTFTKRNEGRINLVYFGAVREYEHICKQIELFAEDERFDVYYYGDGDSYSRVKSYADEKKYSNIHVMGRYCNDEKFKFLNDTDIINNHYPGDKDYPLCVSNKYYDSIIYKRPLLSNIGGIDAKNADSAGIGIALSLEDKQDLDTLYHWYQSLTENEFLENCKKELNRVLVEDKQYLYQIESFANELIQNS